jgi:hypothetical protein
MTFRIAQKPSYTWPVKLQVAADGGKFETHTFDVEFRRLPQGEIDKLLKQAADLEIADADLARLVVVGWQGIEDEDGAALPFSEAARDKVLDVLLVRGAIVEAWIESIRGARRKN